MERLNLEEIKRVELEILVFFDDFCRKHNLKYSLAGGTLLGAVRHKGFIPWDDDIDVMMERRDYEKFINLYRKEGNENYRIINRKTHKQFNYLYSKLVDTRTTLIEVHNKKVKDMGVFIDIFPLDPIGNTYEEAYKKFKKMSFNFYIGIASNWKHFYINKGHGFLRQIIRLFFYIVSRFANINKKYDKIEKLFPYFDNSNYIGCVCSVYRFKDIRESKVYAGYFEIEFEGRKFMAIEHYDDYLRDFYGDYMQLPPIAKRVTHHTFDAYFKE